MGCCQSKAEMAEKLRVANARIAEMEQAQGNPPATESSSTPNQTERVATAPHTSKGTPPHTKAGKPKRKSSAVKPRKDNNDSGEEDNELAQELLRECSAYVLDKHGPFITRVKGAVKSAFSSALVKVAAEGALSMIPAAGFAASLVQGALGVIKQMKQNQADLKMLVGTADKARKELESFQQDLTEHASRLHLVEDALLDEARAAVTELAEKLVFVAHFATHMNDTQLSKRFRYLFGLHKAAKKIQVIGEQVDACLIAVTKSVYQVMRQLAKTNASLSRFPSAPKRINTVARKGDDALAAAHRSTKEGTGVAGMDSLKSMAVDVASDIDRHGQWYHKGTREWVFSKLNAWSQDENGDRAFWINGSGGLGKSVISSQVLAKDDVCPGRVKAGFFCRHNDDRRNNVRVALCSLALQLAEHHAGLAKAMSATAAEVKATLADASRSVDDLFEQVLATPLCMAYEEDPQLKVLIVIDALDEMREGSGRTQLLQALGKLFPTLPSNVRVLVTSRPEYDIVANLQALKPLQLVKATVADTTASKDTMAHSAEQRSDMLLYLRDNLASLPWWESLDAERQHSILEALLKAADGVFLAARLGVQRAGDLEGETLAQVDLEELCRIDLDDTYNETLGRIVRRLDDASGGDQNQLIAGLSVLRRLLSVLVVTRTPLRLAQLLYFTARSRIELAESLARQLMGALTLLFTETGNDMTLEPIHKTVVDFLREAGNESYRIDTRMAYDDLAASSCRALEEYLQQDFQTPANNATLEYALLHGHVYLGMSSKDASAIDAWSDLLLMERPAKDIRQLQTENGGCSCTPVMASGALAMWLLAQMNLHEQRRPLLRGEISKAASGLDDQHHLTKLLRETAQMFGLHWSTVDAESEAAAAKRGAQALVGQTAADGYLRNSGCVGLLAVLLGVIPLSTSIPDTVGLSAEQLCLRSHANTVTCVAYDDGGKRIVSGSGDGTVRVHDALTGEQVMRLECGGAVRSIAVTQGHEMGTEDAGSVKARFHYLAVAVGSSVCVYDMVTGTPLHTLEGHTDWVRSVAFSPDGQHIVSGSDDKTVRVWTTSGTPLHTLEGHTGSVNSVAFSPDGQHIVSGSWDNTVRVWTASGTPLHTLEGHTEFVSSVAFSPDGQHIVSGSGDKTVRVWTTSGTPLHTLKGHTKTVTSVAFSPDGQHIVSGSVDKTVRVWTTSGTPLHTLEGHTDWVRSVAFSPDGQHIVSGSDDKTVRVWTTSGTPLHTLNGHTGLVRSVAFSPDGQHIVSGSDDKTVRVWTTSGTPLHTLEGHTGSVYSVAFSPDGQHIVSGSGDNTVRVWTTFGTPLHTLKGHTELVTSVAFSPDGQHIVSGSGDNTVRVWTSSGTPLHTLKGHTDRVFSVAFSPDGQHIVSGSRDTTVRVWTTSGTPLHTLKGHTRDVYSVAFSPDGQHIVSGSRDNTVRVWTTSGTPLHTLEGHTNNVNSVAFSPDGQHIVSGSGDKTVRVWTTSGTPLHTLKGHTDYVRSVAFSPDGQHIVSGSNDKTVRVWTSDGVLIHNVTDHNSRVTAVAFSGDGHFVVSASETTLHIWSMQSLSAVACREIGRPVASLQVNGSNVKAVGVDGTIVDEYNLT